MRFFLRTVGLLLLVPSLVYSLIFPKTRKGLLAASNKPLRISRIGCGGLHRSEFIDRGVQNRPQTRCLEPSFGRGSQKNPAGRTKHLEKRSFIDMAFSRAVRGVKGLRSTVRQKWSDRP
jgi:hypothetical protein